MKMNNSMIDPGLLAFNHWLTAKYRFSFWDRRSSAFPALFFLMLGYGYGFGCRHRAVVQNVSYNRYLNSSRHTLHNVNHNAIQNMTYNMIHHEPHYGLLNRWILSMPPMLCHASIDGQGQALPLQKPRVGAALAAARIRFFRQLMDDTPLPAYKSAYTSANSPDYVPARASVFSPAFSVAFNSSFTSFGETIRHQQERSVFFPLFFHHRGHNRHLERKGIFRCRERSRPFRIVETNNHSHIIQGNHYWPTTGTNKTPDPSPTLTPTGITNTPGAFVSSWLAPARHAYVRQSNRDTSYNHETNVQPAIFQPVFISTGNPFTFLRHRYNIDGNSFTCNFPSTFPSRFTSRFMQAVTSNVASNVTSNVTSNVSSNVSSIFPSTVNQQNRPNQQSRQNQRNLEFNIDGPSFIHRTQAAGTAYRDNSDTVPGVNKTSSESVYKREETTVKTVARDVNTKTNTTVSTSASVTGIDIRQLSDRVYRQLERRLKLEKERRGW